MPTVQEQLDADNKAFGSISSPNDPGMIGSFLKGAASGATLGLAQKMDQEGFDAASEKNPGSYGTGYALGTAPWLLGAPEAVAGRLLAKGATAAAPLAKGEMLSNVIPAAPKVTSKVANAARRFVTQGVLPLGAEAASNITSTPKIQVPNNPQLFPNQREAVGPVSQADKEDSNPFATLTDFLAQAEHSENPQVLQAAQVAQQAIDPTDPESKRKAAMMLQSTPQGRAVSNSENPYNQA